MGRKGYIALILTIIFLGATSVFAVDPPHGSYDCSACHSLHGSSGAGLTNQPDNATLCIVCHSPGNDAQNKPFTSSMIAIPGISGTSHSWEASMPAAPTAPDSPYGLVAISELTIPGLQASAQRYDDLGEGITCGVCHNQHSQSRSPWDPVITDSGTTDGDGAADGSTIVDSMAGWGALAGLNVKITSGAHSGEVRAIQSNTATVLTVSPVFSGQILSGVTYEIDDDNAWHFMRVDNDLNQLCEDCHAYRVMNHSTVEGPGDGVQVFSHPVGQTLDANAKGYDKAAPLDADGNPQSGARFATGSDANETNNLVFGSDNSVRCLSCHGIHYKDSNSLTIDGP